MKQFSATILDCAPVCADFFELEFTWDKAAPLPQPGQFFTIGISENSAALLRRPFAFSAFDEKRMSCAMIFQKRGRGTGILAARQKGEALDLIGPLGKPFPLPPRGGQAVLVAGGIGLGPIAFLAAKLRELAYPSRMIFGCRTSASIPSSRAFALLNPAICTDDGSAGFRGTAGDYLESIAASVGRDAVLYCCGPMPLLKACHAFALRRGCACFVSVEQIMACGVGACMGCAVKVTGEKIYARACSEGPVFNSNDIRWDS